MLGVVLQADPTVEDSLIRVSCTGSGRSPKSCATSPGPDGTHHVICRGRRRFRVRDFISGYPFSPRGSRRSAPQRCSLRRSRRGFACCGSARGRRFSCSRMSRRNRLARSKSSIGLRACRFRGWHHRCEPRGETGHPGGLRRQGAARQGAWAFGPTSGGARLSKEIGEQTQQSLSSQQREHILREQLRQIQKELGEGDGKARRSPSCARRSTRPKCQRRPRSRRRRSSSDSSACRKQPPNTA